MQVPSFSFREDYYKENRLLSLIIYYLNLNFFYSKNNEIFFFIFTLNL